MLEVTQLRTGTVFEEEGIPFLVLKYEHTKLGRGTANIKVKAKNLLSSAVVEKSFISGARVVAVELEKRRGVYLYHTGEKFIFMDLDSYEQLEISADLLATQWQFLLEGTEVELRIYKDTPFAVNLPLKMKFKVVDTEPGFKGDSVTNIYKEAVLATGAKVKVPLFVNVGEEIVVNTETAEYVQRAK